MIAKDEFTRFSMNDLYVIVVCLSILIGGVLWMGNVDSKASAAAEETKGLRGLVLDIRERIIRIEEKLRK